MKVLFAIALFFTMPATYGQQHMIDSLRSVLANEKTDTGKAVTLYRLSYYYQMSRPDSALLLAQLSYHLSVKNNFLKGQSWSLNQIAGAFNRLGDYAKALEYYIRQLKIEEQLHNAYNIAVVHMDMALVYNSDKDADKALFYAFKADSIIKANKLSGLTLYSLLNTGEILEKADKLPDALLYTQRCYQESLKSDDPKMIGTALSNLGNIYSKMGKLRQAISAYRESIPYLTVEAVNNTLAEGTLGLAKAFAKSGSPDSARYYAALSYATAQRHKFLDHALNASSFLSQLYKQSNLIDSAFAYQEIMLQLDAAIANTEKAKQVQRLTMEEQMRQDELAELREKEKEERSQKLQLLAIGITIPVFFLLSAYISRKQVHKRAIKFLGVLSLLLLFEYITLLVHPFVAEQTHHSPILEIIIFICIAAVITPTHHKIEEMLLHKLTRINELRHQYRTKIIPATADLNPVSPTLETTVDKASEAEQVTSGFAEPLATAEDPVTGLPAGVRKMEGEVAPGTPV